jgi:single-stranded DNA-binding protein
MLNKVELQGRLANFDHVYKEGTDGKASFYTHSINVRKNWKPKDAQYYDDILVKLIVNGHNADFLEKYFANGDEIIVVGELDKDNDYEKDGKTIKGGLIVKVSEVFGCGPKKDKEEGGTKNVKADKPATKASPFGAKTGGGKGASWMK